MDIVCCSLESWDQVWRRNQFLAAELLRHDPLCRILFVEPPIDRAWAMIHGRTEAKAGLRPVEGWDHLWALTPVKWLPRRLHPNADRWLGRQAARAAESLTFEDPVLWINDSGYAVLAEEVGWPVVYDITDDWLRTRLPERELRRQRLNDSRLLSRATEVVVCSADLASSRGRNREVKLIPNGVDVEHFRRAAPRPRDMPGGRTAVYVGTLTDQRVDVGLCDIVAKSLNGQATLVLIGPNHLGDEVTVTWRKLGVEILGPRPYELIPAYMQHADVLVVPHVISPFTESLDPIKAREIEAVGRPAVVTPAAGFRELGPPAVVIEADGFVDAVMTILGREPVPAGPGLVRDDIPSWSKRAADFREVLEAASRTAKL